MPVRTIAVMAGTPVDTRMGRDFLLSRDTSLNVLECPVSRNPVEQTAFQLFSPEKRQETARSIIHQAVSQGAQALLVYCNSLSGALDFDAICADEGLPVVTPLKACAAFAAERQCLGVLAANNQSLHGLERVMTAASPDCQILGASLLPMVLAIESGMPPEEICRRFGLSHLLRFWEACGAQGVVLGCTHFPYLLQALTPLTHLPVLNPDDRIWQQLTELF